MSLSFTEKLYFFLMLAALSVFAVSAQAETKQQHHDVMKAGYLVYACDQAQHDPAFNGLTLGIVGGISSSAVEEGLLDIRVNFGMQRDQVCAYVHVHPDLWTMGMGAGVFRVLDALYPRQY
jgi:hypothetical protein